MKATIAGSSPEDKPTQEHQVDELDPKTVRESAGLTRTEMASLMGMSNEGYTQWEDGARRPGGAAYKLLVLLNNNPSDVKKQLIGE